MILPMPTVIRRATNTTARLRPFRLTAKERSYWKWSKASLRLLGINRDVG